MGNELLIIISITIATILLAISMAMYKEYTKQRRTIPSEIIELIQYMNCVYTNNITVKML